MLGLVMARRHRFPVMFAIPPVHRFLLSPLTFRVTPLIVMMLTRPAIAVMITNLLMMFAPLE